MFEFSRCCLQCGRFALACSFCGAQTVCLTVVCEYLGRLCVLCVVKLRRSRLYCLRGMFVGTAIFIGSICALSRNSRVGAEFRSGKCEFAHVMGNVVKVKSAFVLRAHVYRVPPVLSSTFSVFVVRVYLSIVAVSVPRLRTRASAAACASNHNGLRGLGVLRLRVWSSREFWYAF